MEQEQLIREIEKQNDRIYELRLERNKYLGEFKERVIVALTIEEVNERAIYSEVEDAIKRKDAKRLVISREIDIKKAMKYILLAKKYNKPCKKIDKLNLVGEVGLVVVADDKVREQDSNPIVKSKLERIREKGFPDIYFEAQGKEISKYYMNIIKENFPDLAKDYKQISFFEKLFGAKCPIMEKLQGEIK